MAFDPRKFPNLIPHAYERVRSEVCTGDLLLCSGTGAFSEIIKAATESEFSHVGFIVRIDAIDRIFVFESVESVGVRSVVLSSYVNNYLGSGKGYPGRVMIARHKKFAELADMKKFAQFGADHFSHPFDQDELIRITGRILASKLGFVHDNFIRDKEYICSEYVFETFAAVGIHYAHDPRGFILPADFPKDPHTFPVAVVDVEH
jgi:hypothetical protein